MGKFRSLEMVRAIAALLVVLFHAQMVMGRYTDQVILGNAFRAGGRGVDLFFVLSGFIIAFVHSSDLGRPARLPNYLFNRLSRIYPAVWIMTALAILLYAVGFGGSQGAAKLAPMSIAESALLLPQDGDALVNVTWTLKYELFFYMLFAVVIVNRRLGLALLLCWQVATAAVTLSGVDLGLLGFYFRPVSLEFSIGLACAWWVLRFEGRLPPWALFGLLAVGTVAFAAGMRLAETVEWAGALCALGSGAIIYALVRLEQARKLWVPPGLVFLGGASYAIYLVHFSTITVAAAILARLHMPVTNILTLGVAAAGVAVGVVFDRLADRPIQRWLRQRKGAVLAHWSRAALMPSSGP